MRSSFYNELFVDIVQMLALSFVVFSKPVKLYYDRKLVTYYAVKDLDTVYVCEL